MLIQWFGQACIKVTTKPGLNGEVVAVFDPFDPKATGLSLPKLTADVVVVSHNHPDHNYLAGVHGEYFLINEPGEYEVKQTFFYGIPGYHDANEGTERGAITMYLMESEGLSIAHLSDIGQGELTSEQLEYLEGVDILMLPVGGVYTVNAKQAAAIVGQVEPRIIIPLHYKLPGLKYDLEPVEKFVKELGLKAETMDKLKIVKKDVPQEDTKLIVLTV